MFVFSVADIPILSVVTKSDTLTKNQLLDKMKRLQEYDLAYHVEEQRQMSRASRRKRHPTAPELTNTKLIVNYCSELEPWSDESVDPSSIVSSPDLDSRLLGLWRDIVSRTANCDRRKRAYSATTAPHPICRCLPFKFPYSRLRSRSF